MAKKLILLLQALLLVAAGGLVDGQLLGENDINTEPVDKAKDATKEKDSEFYILSILADKLEFFHEL